MKHRGIFFRIWISFFGVLIIVLGFIYLYQFIFFKISYRPFKEHFLSVLGDKIKNQYINLASSDNEEFYAYIKNISESEAITIYVYYDEGDDNYVNLYSTSLGIEIADSSNSLGRFSEYTSRITENNSFVFISSNENNDLLYYGGYLDTRDFVISGGYVIKECNVYFFLEEVIKPFATDFTLTNIMMGIALFISFILATVMSLFISYRISRPLQKISQQAKILASGNYDFIFDESGYLEIIELGKALNEMRNELAKTSRLQRQLISNISHDLRTPLTLIRSYAEMVRDLSYANDEKRTAHLNVIIDETDRLTNLVNDILTLSKLESGIKEMEVTSFSLSDLIIQIINRFEILTQKDSYEFITSIIDNVIINADRKKIEVAIYNLIANACNYTGDDKKVYINLSIDDGILVEIKDTGMGISNEDINNIWNRYYRSSDSHKRAQIGTGLGLSIVKEIFDAHGFSYGIKSNDGKGSNFWFKINM